VRSRLRYWLRSPSPSAHVLDGERLCLYSEV
jgi:hypothetical protein